jgi:hypothetical protein
MSLRVLALVVLALWACAPSAKRAPTSLDMYADRGPLRVRGARASAPGPAIYRALAADAPRELAGRGEPDTVEVVRRGKALRVVVTYPRGQQRVVMVPAAASTQGRRRAVGSARPTRQRSTVRAPARVETPKSAPVLATEQSEPMPPAAKPPPAPVKTTLTARQALECAIDSDRDECRSVCAGRSDYEWCP